MAKKIARQIVLAARPQGKPQLTDFRLEETAIPAPSTGQVLLQVQYLSLDPYMRSPGWTTGNRMRSRSRSVVSWKANRLRL
jgi:NADPH-dependent curcumin reductase CurA